jgi:hypothetical protein
LPFKATESTVVILKNLPVLQCPNCPEFLIEDPVLERVDELLGRVNGGTGLRSCATLRDGRRLASNKTGRGGWVPRSALPARGRS